METLKNIPQNIREVQPQLPAVGAGAGQEFPQKHRNFDSGQRTVSPNGCSTSRSARPISTIRTATSKGKGWRILLAPVVGLFDARTVPQGAGGIRRQPGVFRRGRRTARFGAATLFLCHRDPDVPGIRTLGSYTRHFDQFAQVPLAQVRIVGQDSRYRST